MDLIFRNTNQQALTLLMTQEEKIWDFIAACRKNHHNLHTYQKEIKYYRNKVKGLNNKALLLSLEVYWAFYLMTSGKNKAAFELVRGQFYKDVILHRLFFEFGLVCSITALYFWTSNQFETAFNFIFKAFDDLKHKKDNCFGLTRLHFMLAIFYFDLEEFEMSKKNYKKLLQLLKKNEDANLRPYAMIGLADISRKTKKGNTIEAFREVVRYTKAHKLDTIEARAHYELGCIHLSNKDVVSAEKYFLESLLIRHQSNTLAAIISCRIKLAEIKIIRQQYPDAIELLEELSKICAKHEFVTKNAKVAELLSEAYYLSGDYKSAYENKVTQSRIDKEQQKIMQHNNTQMVLLKYKNKKAIKEKEHQKKINLKLLQANEMITKQKNYIHKKNIEILENSKEKDTLLKEIHHRVKNNLQVITSLLSLQAFETDQPEILEHFKISQNRIKSMALIHEMLYQSSNLSKINYQSYLVQLADFLIESYKGYNQNIRHIIEADRIYFELDQCIPLGLIFNELITNSIKHSKGLNRTLEIIISISNDPDYTIINYKDNGFGVRNLASIEQSKSLGMNLIRNLTKQLNGKLNIHNNDPGLIFTIYLNK